MRAYFLILLVILTNLLSAFAGYFWNEQEEKKSVQHGFISLTADFQTTAKILSAPASGLIKDVYVTQGQFVKKGDVLFKINSSRQQTKIQALTAEKTIIDQQILLFESDIKMITEDFEKAEIAHQEALTAIEKGLILSKGSAITALHEKLQDLTARKKDIQDRLKTLQQKYEINKIKIADLKSKIEKNLAKAPYDGHITQIQAAQNQIIEKDKPVMAIEQPDQNRLLAILATEKAALLSPGDPARFHYKPPHANANSMVVKAQVKDLTPLLPLSRKETQVILSLDSIDQRPDAVRLSGMVRASKLDSWPDSLSLPQP